MAHIEKTLHVQNRDALVKQAEEIALAIPGKSFRNKKARPYIICINGATNSGKSLFWDVIKDTLLQNTAKKKPHIAQLFPHRNRHMERWHGTDQKTGTNIKILFANMAMNRTSFFDIYDTSTEKLAQLVELTETSPKQIRQLRRYGDLLLLSNVPQPCGDIKINVDFPTIPLRQQWARTVTIITKDKLLTESSPSNTRQSGASPEAFA
ncbi:MAG: hypothetical protein H6860_00230 [Rhodospirillales bacterium]|nr:hypothetical protein [Alphaproteobacteria bacterium]MCB9980820.1 hypothetical protein [Rhodospirillales bacterium]